MTDFISIFLRQVIFLCICKRTSAASFDYKKVLPSLPSSCFHKYKRRCILT